SLDLSNQSSLTYLRIYNNPPLSFLDLRNGATNPMTLNAVNNPNLYCIDVDNVSLANLMWSSANNSIDPWTSFSTNCSSDLGCTDSTACNYNPLATINDGSCIIGNCVNNITQNTFYTVIQTAIDSSVNGDTIIVSPGTYVENINFNGKGIVLASDFLLTGDTSYISSTIIDGNQSGIIVNIDNITTNFLKLEGFTLINGGATINPWNGGALTISGVDSCIIQNLIIKENIINNHTISFASNNYCLFSNIQISQNESSSNLVWIEVGSVIFENVLVENNITSGSILCLHNNSTELLLVNSTLTNNSNSTKSIYGYGAVTVNIENSIIWNNSVDQMEFSNFISNISVNNSLYSGGQNGSENFYSDPLFVDAANQDYRLSNFSPCIGAGLDTSIVPTTDLDGNPRPNPAGSNPDMGAYENALAIPDVLGCMDSTSFTFNSNANISDSIMCCYVGGCIDPTATNYDPNACFNTISCNFLVNNITQNTGYAVIQTAIDSSNNGDTIIVSQGTFVENINFNGKNIVLASEFLLSGDTSYISSTIIDGNNNGRVVTFNSNETNSAHLIGLTVQNGYANQAPPNHNGGGIYFSNSSPILSNLRIINNSAGGSGPGMYVTNSNPQIDNCYIANNGNYGGAIEFFNNCTASVTNSLIINNTGQISGVKMNSSCNIDLINCVILNNSNSNTAVASGIYCASSTLNIVNSIIRDNESLNITLSYGTLNISYSNLEGGLIGIVENDPSTINWGIGNIDVDPLFNDPANGDYRLSNFSPCIGAGLDTSIVPLTDLDG
ncbi:MAG: hypothetical protein HN535_03240, partial [Flavobacteriales bacterium]|nr:hypothetical protein [Flavobacteriales bacterium]